MQRRRIVAALVFLATALPAWSQDAESEPWPFVDWRDNPMAAEQFLQTARKTRSEELPVGITKPLRVTLEHEGVEARSVFKTVDVYRPKMEFEDGHVEFNFRDSYRSEIAAYRLDQLLGTGLVPPTVERSFDGDDGSLRLWIENSMTEHERRERGLAPRDQAQWNRDLANTKVFFNLTGNTDLKNMANLLVDEQFRLCAIDHSRAFTTNKNLVDEDGMFRFSRATLDKLKGLDRKSLDEHLGDWLTPGQIKTLLKRRDMILARADKMIEFKGEEIVLLP